MVCAWIPASASNATCAFSSASPTPSGDADRQTNCAPLVHGLVWVRRCLGSNRPKGHRKLLTVTNSKEILTLINKEEHIQCPDYVWKIDMPVVAILHVL